MKRVFAFRFLLYTSVVVAAGCASLAVVKGDPRINVPQYKTLVVREFDNATGKALPPRVQQDLPGVVIAHLTKCYPGAFEKILRSGHGSPEELIIRGTVTVFQAGSPAFRVKGSGYGIGNGYFAADVAFYDGQNDQQLMLAKGNWVYRYGGGKAVIWELDDLVQASGADVADLIAEKRGATRSEKQGCAKYGEPVPAGK